MISAVNTLSDLKTFYHQLIHQESLNFHPDEDFQNYINLETNLPAYTTEEASFRNELMIQAFRVCEKHQADIYQIGADLLFKHLNSKTL